MNILRLAGEIFAIYLLYKLIFEFIIPIYNATKKVKRQFGEMQSGMDAQLNKFKQQQQANAKSTQESSVKKEDYIDYEEIKTH